MSKNLKISLGVSYLFILFVFLYLIFTIVELNRLDDFSYYKELQSSLEIYISTNIIINLFYFSIFAIIWIALLGFGSPIALLGGFMFGKWLGTIIIVIGLSVGATFLYMFGNYFLKDLIREKFLNKYENLERRFKKSEFYYLLIYRFIGGIPWQLSCILPTIFNVKTVNFFFASLIGIVPQIFLAVSIGSGLEKIIDQNSELPKITEVIFSPEIYIPILAFLSLVLTTIFLRKSFYKN